MTRHYPDLVRASDWLKICLNQSEELPRSWPVPGSQIVGKRQRKRRAKSWRGGKKEKGRERAPALPSLLPFYFRVCAFSSISDPGTGYPDPGSDASTVWNFCVRLSTTTTQTLFQEVASRNVGSFLRLDKFWLTIKKLFPTKLTKDPGYSLGKWIKSLG